MIKINISIKTGRKLYFFDQKPSLMKGLLDTYVQSSYNKKIPGYHKSNFYTIIIDLKKSFQEEFSKSTMYDIQRSKKEGTTCGLYDDINEFISFYNDFIEKRKIHGLINEQMLKNYEEHLILTCSRSGSGDLLVVHSYIIDKEIKRARILHSASRIHTHAISLSDKSMIGRANKYLHLEDMTYFKSLGMEIYDLGGFALNTKDPSLKGINQFKAGFGGTLIHEYNYENYPQYILKKLNKTLFRSQV